MFDQCLYGTGPGNNLIPRMEGIKISPSLHMGLGKMKEIERLVILMQLIRIAWDYNFKRKEKNLHFLSFHSFN